MTTLIERLIELGFKPEHPDDEDAMTLGLIAHAGEHDLFTVQVKTHEWGWTKERGSFAVERDRPKVSLYLPHSCDEWVIAYTDDDPAVARSFAEGAQAGADLFARTLAVINEAGAS